MAVPTITNVSPATGPAAGSNIVVITGTNFAVPTIVYTIPMEDLAPRVSVTIGGYAATAQSVSSTEIHAVVPRYRGSAIVYPYPAVDIVVTNLDADGVAVGGESVTSAGAYTYDRWVIGAPRKDPPMAFILRELINQLMLEIARTVSPTTHIDFAEDASAIVIEKAKLPSIHMVVSTPRDVEWAQWDKPKFEVERQDGTIDLYDGAKTHMLVCGLTVAGEGDREAFFMAQAVEDFVAVNPLLDVDADQDLYPGETHSYPVEMTREARMSSGVVQSSIVAFDMELRVRGITTLPDEPVENVKKITEFVMAEMHMDGSTATEWTY